MTDRRTYRIDSLSRGVEGPLSAAAIVSMARVGLIHPDDRIENVPGSWVSVMAARQIREALAQRATSGL